ncbi:MAG: hypothetical protein LCH82_14090 [Actinobacteria bacterium]|nr:hypothetical protein [Actinomycetota bacterium]
MQIDIVEFVGYILILGVLAALILSDSTSARAARLESFRRRQGVHLAEATAPLVSKALSRSRFWRRVGVLVTLLSGVTVTLPIGTWAVAIRPRRRTGLPCSRGGGWEAGTQPTSRGSQASTAMQLPHPSRAHS